MELTVAYRGHSGIVQRAGSLEVALAPNLRRDRVSFVGALRQPLRFREAMSALHDVVISNLRYKPKDRTACALTSPSSRSARTRSARPPCR